DLLGLLRPRLRGRWLEVLGFERGDRKSTRLTSSHMSISYAVFCLKKKNPLHFTILHSGITAIDPEHHVLVIHGRVKQPLEFTVDAFLFFLMIRRPPIFQSFPNRAPFR